jgi:hypothetical protein
LAALVTGGVGDCHAFGRFAVARVDFAVTEDGRVRIVLADETLRDSRWAPKSIARR